MYWTNYFPIVNWLGNDELFQQIHQICDQDRNPHSQNQFHEVLANNGKYRFYIAFLQGCSNGQFPPAEQANEDPSGGHGNAVPFLEYEQNGSKENINECGRPNVLGSGFIDHYLLDASPIFRENEEDSSRKKDTGECQKLGRNGAGKEYGYVGQIVAQPAPP